MRRLRYGLCCWVSVLAAVLAAGPLGAEDAFYEISADELKLVDGEWPESARNHGTNWSRRFQRRQQLASYAVLDGDGEIYLGENVGRPSRNVPIPRQTVTPQDARDGDAPSRPNPNAVAIRAPAAETVSGSIYVPRADLSGMTWLRFEVDPDQATEEARTNFYLTKARHYARLRQRNLPGGSWFRYQERKALQAVRLQSEEAPDDVDNRRPNFRAGTELQDTFELFTGGRAVSENLQLDRLLQVDQSEEPTIELSSLTGITVREFDWQPLIQDAAPETDPPAELIPHDQYAVLFSRFGNLVTLLDEAQAQGTPVLHLLEDRAQDARSRERYQRQLCLSLDAVSRLLGDRIVGGVAVTGSDPYFRTGTDVAVLFETAVQDVLTEYLQSRYRAAVDENPECREVEGEIRGIAYAGVITPDRSVCSYRARLGNTVAVTNSLVQLEKLSAVLHGEAPSLASLPEYTFFRQRYPRPDAEETALLIVPDAAIRRWGGPKWRIAASRRTRAAAVLAHHQAAHLEELVTGQVEPRSLAVDSSVPDLGTVRLTDSGVRSSTYGDLAFLTPIAELDFTRVGSTEARAYRRWRDTYQRYWRGYFDPIAVRFSVRDDRLSADLTVMPLIEGSEYRPLVQLTRGVRLDPQAGDPHPEALLHYAMAVDVDSEPLRWTRNFLQTMIQDGNAGPLSWMGESVALYVDADPFWKELDAAADSREFLQGNYHRLPVAVNIEVANSLKLSLFLAALRGWVEQTAPDLTRWEKLEHNGRSYVKISGAEGTRGVPEELALYYAATPQALIVTLNEDLLTRALDRQQQPSDEPDSRGEPQRPWLGESLGLKLEGKALGILEVLFGEDYQLAMQGRCWASLPILNEWKRRFPDRDPKALYERLWNVRLRCPGGGNYVWNEQYQTLESTVYGHPGQPKPGPKFPAVFRRARFADFGITFENEGLRAQAVLERAP